MTSRNLKCLETTGRKRVFRALLVAVSVVGLFSSPASGASGKFLVAPMAVSKKQPLVVSQIYFGDLKLCDPPGTYNYSPYPCQKGFGYDLVQTIWAVSVTNPNKSSEARNVRARVILLDASGNEVVNKVMQVTARLAPGQTTWLAPNFGSENDDNRNYSTPLEVDSTEGGSGSAISGTVTILPHTWGARSNLRTVRVPMEFSTKSTCDGSYDKGCWSLNLDGSFPNPGKAYSGYLTVLFFGDNGAPLAGMRLQSGQLVTIRQGGNSVSLTKFIAETFASKIADVQLFVSR